MRRSSFIVLLVGLGACGGQKATDVCVRRLDILGVANINVGAQRTLEAKQSTKSGTCAGKESVTWTLSNTNRLEILSSTDSTAVIRGKAQGLVTVTAYMTRETSVRDSATFTVNNPLDQ